jgi:amino acid transporter
VNEIAAPAPPKLERGFGLLQATALNMANMMGIGPFITIPLFMSAMGGPQAILGWVLAAAIAIPDGMVWGELGAMYPQSGGTYVYLREGYGRERFGRLLAFLFIWQFILSGPLEIASGYIGFAKYLGYLWHGMPAYAVPLVAVGVGLLNIALLYRRITFVSRLTVSLWVGAMLTIGAVILSGFGHFDPKIAFDFPPNAFNFSLGFFLGLGSAMRIGMYDYLGYYDVCYIGDEVRNPARTIPRSIIISVVGVAIIYLLTNMSIIGVVPWRDFVPADVHPDSDFIASIFMQKLHGTFVASIFTVMVLWTAFASVFAALLGYSRIPFAAALDGCFFRVFAKVHPTKHFPSVGVVVIGLIACAACFLSLQTVIDVLITMRILVQFMGQIFAVALLRRRLPDRMRPYKMMLYPLPSAMAFAGWLFIFATSGSVILIFSVVALGAGGVAFLLWSRHVGVWPFAREVCETAQ